MSVICSVYTRLSLFTYIKYHYASAAVSAWGERGAHVATGLSAERPYIRVRSGKFVVVRLPQASCRTTHDERTSHCSCIAERQNQLDLI